MHCNLLALQPDPLSAGCDLQALAPEQAPYLQVTDDQGPAGGSRERNHCKTSNWPSPAAQL